MFGLRKKRKTSELKDVLRKELEHYELPAFSANVMRALSALRNPEQTISEIGRLLQLDPGLSVKILKVVNSASFGLKSPVSHLGHAASLLGRARVESLVVAIAVRGAMPTLSRSGLDMSAFWRTAARRASLSRILADKLHPSTATEAFTAGLLLDMGVPFMAMLKGDKYAQRYNAWRDSTTTPKHT